MFVFLHTFPHFHSISNGLRNTIFQCLQEFSTNVNPCLFLLLTVMQLNSMILLHYYAMWYIVIPPLIQKAFYVDNSSYFKTIYNIMIELNLNLRLHWVVPINNTSTKWCFLGRGSMPYPFSTTSRIIKDANDNQPEIENRHSTSHSCIYRFFNWKYCKFYFILRSGLSGIRIFRILIYESLL